MAQYIFDWLVALFGPIVLVLGAWMSVEVVRLIRTRVRNQNVANALIRLEHAVGTAVGSVSQSYISELKKRSEDGRLSKEDAVIAQAMAIKEAKTYLGPRGLEELRGVIGTGDDALDKWITGLIEAKIAEAKGDVTL